MNEMLPLRAEGRERRGEEKKGTRTSLAVIDSLHTSRGRSRKELLLGDLMCGLRVAAIVVVLNRDCMRVCVLVIEQGATSLASRSFGRRVGDF